MKNENLMTEEILKDLLSEFRKLNGHMDVISDRLDDISTKLSRIQMEIRDYE